MDETTRTKWKIQCHCCKKWFKIDQVETDHIKGHNKFTVASDFQAYFDNILMVGFDGLQILCAADCHPIKTLSEKLGISFEDASVERDVIAICKLKAAQIDAWLKEHGATCAKNPKARRDAVRECLVKEMTNESK
jgi:hypothetical protein